MQDVVIAADLGPNPAPVVELVWALLRQRDLRVVGAWLLTNAHGETYLHELRDGLAMLREVVGRDLLPDQAVAITRVQDADGRVIEDELSPADADAWTQARWHNFRRALRSAGDRPVVFGLVGGRRRTMGALTAAMYQLLARDQDLCLDVRVSERRVEGARAGFYFPEQVGPCGDEDGPIDPASVEVHLVALQLPRLRRILREHDLRTYDQALAATGVALDQAAVPTLVVDIPARRVELDGEPVMLSESQLIWYAALALARRETAEGWLTSDAHEALLRRVMEACGASQRGWAPRSKILQRIRAQGVVQSTELGKLKSDTARRMRQHCRAHGLVRQDLVIPTKHRKDASTHRQRIALPPERITVHLERTR